MSNYTTNYTSPEYEPTGAVKYFDTVPRYGYTEDFYELIEGDRKNYLLGVMGIPGIVGAITVAWFVMLAVFSTCRSSFLSGKSLYYRESALIRAAFLFSAFVVLSSSIMFLTLGGDSFSEAFNNFEGSKNDLFKLANEGIDILRTTRILVGNLTENNQVLQDNIAEGVCDDFPEEVTNVLESISSTIVSSDYTDAISQLQDFEDGLGDTFSSETQSDVDELLETVEKIVNYLKYGGLPFIVTSFILGCGAVLSWKGSKSSVYYSFQSCFILPLFICLEIISGIIISLLAIVLVIFSDLCTGGKDQSPEGSLGVILDANMKDEVVRKAFDHYIITGCRTPNPFSGLIETKDALTDISGDIIEVLDTAHQYFESVCIDNSSELKALLKESNSELIDLNYELEKGITVTGCENINSMFVTAMHEGTCRSTPRAMWWMFGCFFAAWVGGLFMLATRAACQPSRHHKGFRCDTEQRDSFSSGIVDC